MGDNENNEGNEGTIRETMVRILAEIRAVNYRLDVFSGRLEAHDTLLAAHSIKLALLDQSQTGNKDNWGRIIGIGVAVMQALILAQLVAK